MCQRFTNGSYHNAYLANLYFFIIGGRVVDQFAVLGETGAVARAIPGMLGAVVFEGTTEVRASGDGGSQKSHDGFKGVNGKLWAQHATGWRKKYKFARYAL